MKHYRILVLVKGFTFANFEAIVDTLAEIWRGKYRIDGNISHKIIKRSTLVELLSDENTVKQTYVNQLIMIIWQKNKSYCEIEIELEDIKSSQKSTTWKTEEKDYVELIE